MSKGDLLVDRGAASLLARARRGAGPNDGVGEWLSEELRADAEFLRKLKPSLIAARARGGNPPEPEAPRDYAGAPPPPPTPEAKPKKKKKKAKSGGPSPLLVVGGALVAGIVIAKVVDWRGHAHPRD
jgi:hypothetical protein